MRLAKAADKAYERAGHIQKGKPLKLTKKMFGEMDKTKYREKKVLEKFREGLKKKQASQCCPLKKAVKEGKMNQNMADFIKRIDKEGPDALMSKKALVFGADEPTEYMSEAAIPYDTRRGAYEGYLKAKSKERPTHMGTALGTGGAFGGLTGGLLTLPKPGWKKGLLGVGLGAMGAVHGRFTVFAAVRATGTVIPVDSIVEAMDWNRYAFCRIMTSTATSPT